LCCYTSARSSNPELAKASVDELLALVAVLLSGPEGWIRSGSEGLAHHALGALVGLALFTTLFCSPITFIRIAPCLVKTKSFLSMY
jgi:hypothetical protein